MASASTSTSQSQSPCLICQTLFPSPEALTSHLYEAHPKIVSIIPSHILSNDNHDPLPALLQSIFKHLEDYHDLVNQDDYNSSDDDYDPKYVVSTKKICKNLDNIVRVKCDTCNEVMYYDTFAGKVCWLEAVKNNPQLQGGYLLQYKENRLSYRAAEYRSTLVKLGLKTSLTGVGEYLEVGKGNKKGGVVEKPVPVTLVEETVTKVEPVAIANPTANANANANANHVMFNNRMFVKMKSSYRCLGCGKLVRTERGCLGHVC
jgi:hypothetical protein